MQVKEWTAVIMLGAGVALAFVSLFLPPPGVIHESVLYIFAQILIYAGSVFGLASYVEIIARSKGRKRKE
ncbi:MAG: hypothetical protein K6E54_08130 [Bacteroidaceae bacterium]|nr:hypothetical protein [Bacteroidaceae bacterium]